MLKTSSFLKPNYCFNLLNIMKICYLKLFSMNEDTNLKAIHNLISMDSPKNLDFFPIRMSRNNFTRANFSRTFVRSPLCLSRVC